MLQQAHDGAGQQKKEQLTEVTKRIYEQELKLEHTLEKQSSIPSSSSSSWTSNYQKWNLWEDAEQIKESLESDKRAQDSLLKNTRAMTGCSSHDRSAERRVAELSLSDRLGEMKGFCEQGNSYYDEGQYARAAMKYKKAVIYYEYCFPENEEEEKQTEEIRLTALSNSAACFLKVKAYEDTLDHCDQVLKVDPQNVKCLYRRAVAHRCRDEFEKAKESILAAISIDPKNPTLRYERNLLRGRIKNYSASRKAMGDKMFQRNHADSAAQPKEAPQPLSSGFLQTDAVVQAIMGDKKLELDDMFVPIAVDTSEAEKTIASLVGINFADATSLRKITYAEEKSKGSLSWTFRHPASCECAAPEIILDNPDWEDDAENDAESDTENDRKSRNISDSEPDVEVDKIDCIEPTGPPPSLSSRTAAPVNVIPALLVVLFACVLKLGASPPLLAFLGLAIGLAFERGLGQSK
mmetsp:Transcript_22694/g.47243  ORF Transcript_22694/g.47243 Transcript_22694/m.47243 type:complete len:464 (-) Transcript_22694:29-1420(-)